MPALNYTAASTNYVAHSTWAIVELWGGGGTGGSVSNTSGNSGGGGGGGEYRAALVTLAPGSTYAVAVAQTKAGVVGGTANGDN
jgi:hypothetical protein